MELWIRTQDKECLTKVEHLYIDNENKIRQDCDLIIGEYKTKERALEVLDEIQNIINPMLIFKNCNCTKDELDNIKEVGGCIVTDNAHIEQVQICIYEMPED